MDRLTRIVQFNVSGTMNVHQHQLNRMNQLHATNINSISLLSSENVALWPANCCTHWKYQILQSQEAFFPV